MTSVTVNLTGILFETETSRNTTIDGIRIIVKDNNNLVNSSLRRYLELLLEHTLTTFDNKDLLFQEIRQSCKKTINLKEYDITNFEI